jgi:hypothetical protein
MNRIIPATLIILGALCGCRPAPADYSDLPRVSLEEVYPRSVRVHVVKKGETLSAIARQHGVPLQSIIDRNPGLQPDLIQIGQRIILPPSEAK